MKTEERELAIVALTEIKEEGEKTTKQVRGFLAFEYGVEGKEATELLTEAGFTVGVKGGGLTDTMKFLEDSPKTEDELYRYVIENGTKNEARWIAQRNSIRLLSVAIYTKFDEDFTEVPASAELKKAITAIVKAK